LLKRKLAELVVGPAGVPGTLEEQGDVLEEIDVARTRRVRCD
jgi:hypothetical protein